VLAAGYIEGRVAGSPQAHEERNEQPRFPATAPKRAAQGETVADGARSQASRFRAPSRPLEDIDLGRCAVARFASPCWGDNGAGQGRRSSSWP